MRTKEEKKIFSERLTYALERSRYNDSDVARKVGVDKSSIVHYKTGISIPNGKNLNNLAKVLDVSVEWLLGETNVMRSGVEENVASTSIDTRRINILESISCGCGVFNDGLIIDTIQLPSEMFNKHIEYFGIYAVGDSMTNAGIDDGDLLIFERAEVPIENKIGAFCIDNEYAICKRYKSSEGHIFLLSANDNYSPIVIDVEDECFRCVGLLSHIMKKV